VARVIAVLELIADGVTVTPSQVAARLNLPVSSAHSLIKRLKDLEYLEQAPGERGYRAGAMLVRLGIRITSLLNVVTVAHPFIAQLARTTGEDTYFAIADSNGIVYADRVEGRQSLRLSIALGEPRPLHSTAVGKLFLAYLSEEELERVLVHIAMVRHTERTITSQRALMQEIRAIRKSGYSVTDQEHLDGVAAVAAPVLNTHNKFVGSITIALPRSRFTAAGQPLIESVVEAGAAVSRQLGWMDTSPVRS